MRTWQICMIGLIHCLLLPLLMVKSTHAQTPYHTWYLEEGSDPQKVQHVYVPEFAVFGADMTLRLSAPSDLFAAPDGNVYVADTGNNRIVVFSAAGEFVRSIGDEDGLLNQPEGVFVTEDGSIYVANTGDETIVKFRADGKLERVYDKPDAPVLYEDYYFRPTKLVVDQRGVIYVVVKDTYQGLLRINPEGEFTGFFGANKASLTWLDRLKRFLLSKEQLAQEIANRPAAIQNITLDDEGFLYTTSSGSEQVGQIKKLNAGGVDAFRHKRFSFHDLVDTAVDARGFLYAVSRENGTITLFDQTGQTLFMFGGSVSSSRQLGIIGFPTSIAVTQEGNLWVSDSALNLIHVFKRTNFGETFLHAAYYDFVGDYAQSTPYWEQVMQQNGMMNRPLNGFGKYALHEGRYREAMTYFKDSYDDEGYSEAFWHVRYMWLQKYGAWFLTGTVIGMLALRLLWKKLSTYSKRLYGQLSPRWRRICMEIRDIGFTMFHPYQGFYRLKDRRISVVTLVAMFLLVLGTHLIALFGSGFLHDPYDRSTINVPLSVGSLIVPWITWVIACYLVSSVKGGEGRLREVLQASTYALAPYPFLTVPIVLISHVLVLEEWIVIELMQQMMWVWIVVLFFVMTQVIHNFDFLETVRNVTISLCTIVVMWIFAIILMALSVNLMDFIQQLIREVILFAEGN